MNTAAAPFPDNFSSLLNDIVCNCNANSNQEIIIFAGHYCISPELADLSSEGETESFSFELGIRLYQSLLKHDLKPRMILWVNDIGINAEERNAIKESFTIPENYCQTLKNAGVNQDAVKVVFESSSRNKASTLLRKRMKKTPEKFKKYNSGDSNLIRCIDMDVCSIEENKTVYTIPGPEGDPLVMKEGSNPKCNLILATLFYQSAQKNDDALFINVFNDIYIERIRLGTFVAKEVYDMNQTFINLFCDEDSFYREDFTINQGNIDGEQ